MVNVPTFENVPNFGSASAKTQPEPSTYVGGYIPGQVFPAEHENWFMAALTTNGNTQQTALISVVSELDTILTEAGITPASGNTDQVFQALNVLYASQADIASVEADIASLQAAQNSYQALGSGTHNIPPLPLQVPVTLIYRVDQLACVIKTPTGAGTYAGYISYGTFSTTKGVWYFYDTFPNVTLLTSAEAPLVVYITIVRQS